MLELILSKGYILETTEDGSPSLRLQKSVKACTPNFTTGESMHHMGGAASETKYIYGEVCEWLKTHLEHEPCLLSVGLGLGYIELLIALYFPNNKFILISYEKDPFLRMEFLSWVETGKSNLGTIYEQICVSLYKLMQFEPLDQEYSGEKNIEIIKQTRLVLFSALKDGRWLLRNEINEISIPQEKFHGIFFDAFSGKTNPELWSENFLFKFLHQVSALESCFSSYACTGNLKRALKRNEFKLQIRKGFKGKRDSCFAVRLLSRQKGVSSIT